MFRDRTIGDRREEFLGRRRPTNLLEEAHRRQMLDDDVDKYHKKRADLAKAHRSLQAVPRPLTPKAGPETEAPAEAPAPVSTTAPPSGRSDGLGAAVDRYNKFRHPRLFAHSYAEEVHARRKQSTAHRRQIMGDTYPGMTELLARTGGVGSPFQDLHGVLKSLLVIRAVTAANANRSIGAIRTAAKVINECKVREAMRGGASQRTALLHHLQHSLSLSSQWCLFSFLVNCHNHVEQLPHALSTGPRVLAETMSAVMLAGSAIRALRLSVLSAVQLEFSALPLRIVVDGGGAWDRQAMTVVAVHKAEMDGKQFVKLPEVVDFVPEAVMSFDDVFDLETQVSKAFTHAWQLAGGLSLMDKLTTVAVRQDMCRLALMARGFLGADGALRDLFFLTRNTFDTGFLRTWPHDYIEAPAFAAAVEATMRIVHSSAGEVHVNLSTPEGAPAVVHWTDAMQILNSSHGIAIGERLPSPTSLHDRFTPNFIRLIKFHLRTTPYDRSVVLSDMYLTRGSVCWEHVLNRQGVLYTRRPAIAS